MVHPCRDHNVHALSGILGVHKTFPFSQSRLRVLEALAGFQFIHFGLVVGIALTLMIVAGIALRLGPTLPCVLLGMFAVRLFLIIFVVQVTSPTKSTLLTAGPYKRIS